MVAASGIRVSLYVGASQPTQASKDLMQALSKVVVTQRAEAPSGFQLTFTDERLGASTEYPLLSDPGLKPFNRLALTATVKGKTQVLIDGYITHLELNPDADGCGSAITVTGEDVSVKMDLFEVSTEFPEMGDSTIVQTILGKYSSLGITPKVSSTTPDVTPANWVPQQNATDRAYMRTLAAKYGYYFYVVPGPSVGQSQAVWGPPVRSGSAQTTLTVNAGPATNILGIQFTYDSLAPTVTYGSVLDETQSPPQGVDVGIGSSTRDGELATQPALTGGGSLASDPLSFYSQLETLKLRGSLFKHQGMDQSQATGVAQAKTNFSTDQVVSAKGEVDTEQIEEILAAPGLVAVRGAGKDYDGLYYVNEVTHQLDVNSQEWSYKQAFALTREGLEPTISTVPVAL